MSLLEVEFKGRRKGIFSNPQEFPLRLTENVVVKADRGEDMGKVSLLDTEWVERFAELEELEQFEPILRRANDSDIQKHLDNKKLEKEARSIFIDLVRKHELVMKLVDAEYQLDHRKLTFYFTAEGRVDFRALVKDLAHEFRTRIDLRQIGARDESKKLGGIGICGRELCCATWIREFQPVTTSMVKEQHLLLNPQKNTGLCGRLRCCLRYEIDHYRIVNQLFPKVETKVTGPRGSGVVEKIDICSQSCGILWEDDTRFSFTQEQLKLFSDWKPEQSEQTTLLTFHKDPTIEEEKTGKLVATADYMQVEAEKKSKPAENGKRGKSKPEAKTDKKPFKKPNNKQQRDKKAPPPPVVLVEAVPLTRSDENEPDMDLPHRSQSKPKQSSEERTAGSGQKRRSSGQKRHHGGMKKGKKPFRKSDKGSSDRSQGAKGKPSTPKTQSSSGRPSQPRSDQSSGERKSIQRGRKRKR